MAVANDMSSKVLLCFEKYGIMIITLAVKRTCRWKGMLIILCVCLCVCLQISGKTTNNGSSNELLADFKLYK